MRAKARAQLHDGSLLSASAHHSLNLQRTPVLQTSTACKSGMAFLELLPVETMSDDRADSRRCFLIALQLEACSDFDLYADGRLIRPREFDAGSIAIFDLRTNLAMDRRDPFHAVDLYLPRRSLDALAQDANSPVIDELQHEPGRALRDPVARHLLLTIRPALSASKHASELFVDHVAMALATHVAHTYGGLRARSDAKVGRLARRQERRAKELLSANLTGGITLADLATACELSIRHFTRAFRASTGMSPHAWLLQLRMEKAKHSHQLSPRVGHIALDCGFRGPEPLDPRLSAFCWPDTRRVAALASNAENRERKSDRSTHARSFRMGGLHSASLTSPNIPTTEKLREDTTRSSQLSWPQRSEPHSSRTIIDDLARRRPSKEHRAGTRCFRRWLRLARRLRRTDQARIPRYDRAEPAHFSRG